MYGKKPNTTSYHGYNNKAHDQDAKKIFSSYAGASKEEDSFDWIGQSTGKDSNPKISNPHGGKAQGLKSKVEEKQIASHDKDSFDWVGTSTGKDSMVKKSNAHVGLTQGLKPIHEEKNQSSYGSEFERSQTQLAESRVYEDSMMYSKDPYKSG